MQGAYTESDNAPARKQQSSHTRLGLYVYTYNTNYCI